MTTKPAPKRCVACGLQKPITAFLQINGPQGTTYGNVCSTCRGSAGLINKVILPATDIDEQSSSSTGLKIDSKAKNFVDRENKERLQQKEAKKTEESKKRDQLSEKRIDTLDNREKNERRHREEYLTKPTSFLNKTPPAAPPPTVEQAPTDTTQIDQQQLQQESAMREEVELKTPNLANTFIDPAIAGGIGFNSEGMLRMRDWLGGAAPINRLKKILATPAQDNPAAPTPQAEAKPQIQASEQIKLSQMKSNFNAQQTKNVKTAHEKKTLVDQIKETWQPTPPNSTRRR